MLRCPALQASIKPDIKKCYANHAEPTLKITSRQLRENQPPPSKTGPPKTSPPGKTSPSPPEDKSPPKTSRRQRVNRQLDEIIDT
eukprot:1186194-Amorphochlora_amoeboformis.AAC.1